MVVYRNQKYACLNCLRGHRASSCEHKNRILLQVGKRGRRPQAESHSRLALIRNSERGGDCCKSEDEFKVIRVTVPDKLGPSTGPPSCNPYASPYSDSSAFTSTSSLGENQPSITVVDEVAPSSDPAGIDDEDTVVFTEKYVFVHVGGNLFRREVRPDITISKTPARDDSPKMEHVDASDASVPKPPNYFEHALSSLQTNDQDSQHVSQSILGNAVLSPEPEVRDASELFDSDHLVHAVGTEIQRSDLEEQQEHPEAPLVIAPMQYQEYGQQSAMSFLNRIGISSEEAHQFWPGDLSSTNLLYTPDCAIPGQCKCGDSCKCEDCYEHNQKHAT